MSGEYPEYLQADFRPVGSRTYRCLFEPGPFEVEVMRCDCLASFPPGSLVMPEEPDVKEQPDGSFFVTYHFELLPEG